MPYIKKEQKKKYKDILLKLKTNNNILSNPGELTYAITKLYLKYLKQNKRCYKTFNDIIGAIECSKMEFYRREIVKYEKEKIKENGDCY